MLNVLFWHGVLCECKAKDHMLRLSHGSKLGLDSAGWGISLLLNPSLFLEEGSLHWLAVVVLVVIIEWSAKNESWVFSGVKIGAVGILAWILMLCRTSAIRACTLVARSEWFFGHGRRKKRQCRSSMMNIKSDIISSKKQRRGFAK